MADGKLGGKTIMSLKQLENQLRSAESKATAYAKPKPAGCCGLFPDRAAEARYAADSDPELEARRSHLSSA